MYPTQLAKMSFDEILDLTADVFQFFYKISIAFYSEKVCFLLMTWLPDRGSAQYQPLYRRNVILVLFVHTYLGIHTWYVFNIYL